MSHFEWCHVVLMWISVNFEWKNGRRYHFHLFPYKVYKLQECVRYLTLIFIMFY
jgi:hypothetical protein